jgi:hypothetical protein
MQADNTKPVIHIYKPVKVNKTSTIYEIEQTKGIREPKPEDYFTDIVKIEQYQGYSKAYNLTHYFRIRDNANWSKCKTPTGLFRTIKPNVFFGDLKTSKGKTLILFYVDEVNNLQIFKYPNGYYPTSKQLNLIINKF